MIERQAKEQVNNMAQNLERQGLQLEVYLQYIGQTPEEFEESQLPAAERRVRLELALEKVAAAEAFEIAGEALEAEYEKVAEQYKLDIERVKKLISEDDMKASLVREKAIDFVKEKAIAVPAGPNDGDEMEED